MSSLNRVQLVGNLGSNPDLLFGDSDNPCLKLSLATNDVWEDKSGQRQERTEWHRVDLWGPRAKRLSSLLSKGMKVMIDGSIRSHTVDEGGTKRKYIGVRARDLMILDWRDGGRATSAVAGPPIALPAEAGVTAPD